MNYLLRNATFFFTLSIVSLATTDCRKEEPPRESTEVANPFTHESVFAEVKKKTEVDPRDADAWYHLADLYERSSQYAEAADALKKVVQIKPGMGYAHLRLGNIYNRLNRPEDAVKAFKKALSILPDKAVAYNNLGVAYGRLGRRKEQIQAFNQALNVRPRYATARYNLGMAYISTGDKRSAQRQYEALKAVDQGLADSLVESINKIR